MSPRTLRFVVIALATTLLGFWPAAPAVPAAKPAGPARLDTSGIDAHLGYQKQRTCSPSAKPGTVALLALLRKSWGGGSYGISRSCGVGGVSEHKEGRALDWKMSVKSKSQRKRVASALNWLTANNGEVAYRIGVMYIIWDQHIWSLYYPELGWRKMPSRGSRTANHKDHVHISMTWDGAMKQTSWWTGVPNTNPLNTRCGSGGAPACLAAISRSKQGWTSTATAVPASFLPHPWVKPGIGGSPQVGRTLRAVPGTWVPDGATLSYQWLANDKPVGTDQDSYLIRPSDVGKEISVRIRATSGSQVVTRTSDGTAEVYRGRFSHPELRPAGVAAPGETLGVDLTGWDPQPTSISYQWYRNGKLIKGATKAEYAVRAGDQNQKLAVKITAKAAGYYSLTVKSVAVKVLPEAPPPPPEPTPAPAPPQDDQNQPSTTEGPASDLAGDPTPTAG